MDETDTYLAEAEAFRHRVYEAADIARAAIANAITALASATVAIVGAALTAATAKFETTSVAKAMIFAIAGAGFSALALLTALSVEAMRTTRQANKWIKEFYRYVDKVFSGEKPDPIPWDELRETRLAVSIHWKISVPACLFVLGLLLALGSVVLDMDLGAQFNRH